MAVAVVRGVARARDELLEEIELIYRRRYPAFLRVAVAITRDEQLGADAVQDAFVGIVRSRRGIRRRGRGRANGAHHRGREPRSVPRSLDGSLGTGVTEQLVQPARLELPLLDPHVARELGALSF
jgi:hypothetical protein